MPDKLSQNCLRNTKRWLQNPENSEKHRQVYLVTNQKWLQTVRTKKNMDKYV